MYLLCIYRYIYELFELSISKHYEFLDKDTKFIAYICWNFIQF